MPGRVYYDVLDAVSVAAITDLWYVAAPTDAVVYVEEVILTQDTSEASEQLPLMLFRTGTDNAAAGTGKTPNPEEVGDPAFGGVVRTLITAGNLATVTTRIRREAQNIANGWFWKGSYEEPLVILSPTAGAAGRAVVKLDAAPGTALIVSGTLKLREIGG
jgi:hypothetical protein